MSCSSSMFAAMMAALLVLPASTAVLNGNFTITSEGQAAPWLPLNVSRPPEYRQASLGDYGISGEIRLGARMARLEPGEGVKQEVLFLTGGVMTWELLVSVGKSLREPRGTAAFARIEVSDGTDQQQLGAVTQPLLLPGSTLRLLLPLNLTGTAALLRVTLSSAIVFGGGVIDVHNVVLQPIVSPTPVVSTTDEGLLTTQESTVEDTTSTAQPSKAVACLPCLPACMLACLLLLGLLGAAQLPSC